jgi:hypothetical protein
MDPQPGRQRLTLLVIGRKAEGVGSIREQRYSLDLPGIILKKEGEKDFAALGQGVAKPLAPEVGGNVEKKAPPANQTSDLANEPPKGFSPVTPVTALVIFLAVLGLALLGAAGYAVYRYWPSLRRQRRQTRVLNQGAKGPTKKVEPTEGENIEEPMKNQPAAVSDDAPAPMPVEEPAETATAGKSVSAPAPGAQPAANLEKTMKEEPEEPEEPKVSAPAKPEEIAEASKKPFEGEIHEEELLAMLARTADKSQTAPKEEDLPDPVPAAREEPLPEPIQIPPEEEDLKLDLKNLSF